MPARSQVLCQELGPPQGTKQAQPLSSGTWLTSPGHPSVVCPWQTSLIYHSTVPLSLLKSMFLTSPTEWTQGTKTHLPFTFGNSINGSY